ncbi:MAG: aminotransferase class I/II-fold pyridoxal phosphate-dependent enzyme [Lachnospiraceae bacterium]|nr:aminotransferase class I/II-fold pyridoxal phosphate-dependent enzyme [Lachnospiraceae bacterium]MBQ1640637.1 aminotransferase class I/II-fold pyridoxal phosphate-dependent enzyme [Lachnospiraceae bacterium]MBQ2503335.1 aminotransferase class I/II-fold pyridoxal phosphate-dependent enzyme [Lachnospiraceae bacterium]
MAKHGGNIDKFYRKHGFYPLDFSANISPLGMPGGVKNALMDAAAGAAVYPDPECTLLREAIAKNLSDVVGETIFPEQVYCGNGAADLIYRLVYGIRPVKALLPAPCFLEYEAALQQVDAEIVYYETSEKDQFRIKEDILDQITEDIELVFITQPNNPTGAFCDMALLHDIMQRCSDVGARLVVDECFMEFVKDPAEHTMLPCVVDNNLVILKSFTKAFGMAGVRLGYLVTRDEMLIDILKRVGAPWSVSYLAQKAGIAALREDEFIGNLGEMIADGRKQLETGLKELGIRVIPGEANYLLLYCEKENFKKLLEEKGILIRTCIDYHGLGMGWYRIAVRKPEDNQKLLDACKEIL